MKNQLTAGDIALVSIFTVLTAVLAQVSIPLPFTPVPISFGLVAVYITGILLKPKAAVMAQICYLLLGAAGLPVFGNFQGGLSALFGNTGGYLLVYPIMAWIVSMALNSRRSLESEKILSKNKKEVYIKAAVSLCAAHLVIYFGGSIWLSFTAGITLHAAFVLAVYPFILLDIVKLLFCFFVIVPLRFRFRAMRLILQEP